MFERNNQEEHKEGEIIIDAQHNSDSITINYRDNGKGIPDELQKKIFDPFFTTRRGSGGTGLGLSIAYNLVTASLDGTIDVKSEQRQGTHFSINIPVHNKLTSQEQNTV